MRGATKSRPFKVKLPLCGYQVKLHKIVHCPDLKCLDAIYPESYLRIFSAQCLARKHPEERCQDLRIIEPEYLLFDLPLKPDAEKARLQEICHWY
jgi:hypothetical protein